MVPYKIPISLKLFIFAICANNFAIRNDTRNPFIPFLYNYKKRRYYLFPSYGALTVLENLRSFPSILHTGIGFSAYSRLVSAYNHWRNWTHGRVGRLPIRGVCLRWKRSITRETGVQPLFVSFHGPPTPSSVQRPPVACCALISRRGTPLSRKIGNGHVPSALHCRMTAVLLLQQLSLEVNV